MFGYSVAILRASLGYFNNVLLRWSNTIKFTKHALNFFKGQLFSISISYVPMLFCLKNFSVPAKIGKLLFGYSVAILRASHDYFNNVLLRWSNTIKFIKQALDFSKAQLFSIYISYVPMLFCLKKLTVALFSKH